jgi:hypothetical protein
LKEVKQLFLGLIAFCATLIIGVAAIGSLTGAQFRIGLVIPVVILGAVIARLAVRSLQPYLITTLMVISAGLGIAIALFIVSLF